MSDYFLGEIRMFGFAWAPQGWAICNGAILPVNQNQALYSLCSNIYGGTPQVNFALPDLRGRVPIGQGRAKNPPQTIYNTGAKQGVETVTLTAAQTPAHSHTVIAVNSGASAASPNANYIANVKDGAPTLYVAPTPTLTALNPGTVSSAGGAAHSNMQPYSAVNFCISLTGVYPPRP